MKLSIIGSGYVGLVTAVCFAEMGNRVIGVDIDEKKIKALRKGQVPIYEPGLETLLKRNLENRNLVFTTAIREAITQTEVVFIAVGTPMGEDGSADLQYVLAVARDIGRYMTHPLLLVDKSTVPVGTAERVKQTVAEELRQRNAAIEFDVVSNPEFLKEGAAVDDFMKPDRVVVGADNDKSMEIMKELYRPFTLNHERFVGMDVKSAEMTKYAANAMLATKISFMNEIANICERVGADVNKVRLGIGSDRRIGYYFIYPGVGYGGSCFPKDVRALIKTAQNYSYQPLILEAVETVNNRQKLVIVEKIVKRFGADLSGKIFAMWGLAFKPETDDMRDAPAIKIIQELVKRGAQVHAYDPQAIEQAQTCYLKNQTNIAYFESKYDVLNGAEALLLVTEWKEFRSPDFGEVKKRLRQPVIFDGRNQYDPRRQRELGFEYYQIGVRETT